MSKYSLAGEQFTIKDYDKVPAFSSFLPGLAGIKGIPVWVFYTNRGQGINSFGIHHKGNAIMEFNPANTAYENTPVKGFRTFVKCGGEFYEPFCTYDEKSTRTMHIEKNTFSIEDVNENGIKTEVEYIVLPNDSIGALMRRVTLTNTGSAAKSLEVVDGMPKIIPYGISNGMYKEMSNLYRSWTEIKNIENNAPYYTMRASSDDSAEVSEIEGGYFYCTVADNHIVPVIYDPDVVFGYDLSLVKPVSFMEKDNKEFLSQEQCFANKIPCGFTHVQMELKAGESKSFTTFIGFAGNVSQLNSKIKEFAKEGFVEKKFEEARTLMRDFMKDIETHTSSSLFDQYAEQCYLDNFLRGGYPYVFNKDKNKSVVHLFSRKHGDPERDYNFFSIAGEYYSQGNGNYRDVCQNRRNDVFFNKDVEDFNVYSFFSLVQMDGYNPLEIRPSTFVIAREKKAESEKVIEKYVAEGADYVKKAVAQPFTPGKISNTIAAHGLKVNGNEDELVLELLNMSSEQIEAGFGEGYWSDHWDYNMDLVENFLQIYPDRKEELLFGRKNYRFYDSIGVVRPRKDTYVLNKGHVRQYGSMFRDENKLKQPGFAENGTNWLKTAEGKEFNTTLFCKMTALSVNKFALLDSFGMGVEMDGGKPGWNDAMNGLPGLFGSSMPETFELRRLISFMYDELCSPDISVKEIELPEELAWFMRDLKTYVDESAEISDFEYWDKTAARREAFRECVRYNISGETVKVPVSEMREIYKAFLAKTEAGIKKAMEVSEDGIIPTYFTYEAVKYEKQVDENGKEIISPYGLPAVTVSEFKLNRLPAFLEGPARMLSSTKPSENAVVKKMAEKIRKSELYDKKLKMYKTSCSIESLSMENGRVRAFTPGWLERESIFLHMEYKYFLGLLKAGLYEEYYEAVKDALIPFLSPEMYGRSILENSSFIASSVNPDKTVHGRGFVARLSGSTTEFISMWIGMFLGEGGFTFENAKLGFKFAPKLAGWLFDDEHKAGFKLCGTCDVTYINESGKSTFGENAACVSKICFDLDGSHVEIAGDSLPEETAVALRNGKITSMDVILA